MPPTALSDAIARVARPLQACPSDEALIAAFVTNRSDAAFTELVRRHGPMVLGVCRRITGHNQDAEDAFQATFLVLARRAAVVSRPEQIGNWLYGVAVRTARDARITAARRRTRETPTHPLPEVGRADTGLFPDEFQAILDEELVRLPQKYRTLIVLCDLRGEPQATAARRLGLPVGTVYTRLAKGRKTLASRLEKRGVSLSVACLTLASDQVASAAMLSQLTARTVALAVSPRTVPAPVAALSKGVLRLMLAHRLKSISLALGLAAVVICGSLLFANDPPTANPETQSLIAFADPPKPATLPGSRAADPKPLPKGPNKILFFRAGSLTLIDPDGRNSTKLCEKRADFVTENKDSAKLSPDGKHVGVLIQEDPKFDFAKKPFTPSLLKLYVRELNGPEPWTDLGVQCEFFIWSPDGTEIAFCEVANRSDKALPDMTTGIVNVTTKERTRLKLPEGHEITDWARNGKHFLTTKLEYIEKLNKLIIRQYLINRDGTGETALTPSDVITADGRLSPDEKRILCLRGVLNPKSQIDFGRNELTVFDIASKTFSPVADIPRNAELQGYCWSPDGKQIAYAWREIHEGKRDAEHGGDKQMELIKKETASHLIVCDPDGKNPKTIATEKAPGQWWYTISAVDWR